MWKNAGAVLCLAASGWFVPCAADAGTPTATNGVGLFPLDNLPSEMRPLASEVTEHPTFEIEIGPRDLHGNKLIFEYLVDRLEICALAGRCLHVGIYQTRREKDGRIFGDDCEGATGYLTFLQTIDGKRVFFVEGEQKGLFNIGGHSVVALDYAVKPGGDDALHYKLHVWIHVDNRFIAFCSRLFLSRSKSVAEGQFSKLLGIPVGVAQKIHDDPRAVLNAFATRNDTDQLALRELKLLIEKSGKK